MGTNHRRPLHGNSLVVALIVATPFIGRYMANVLEGERNFLSPALQPIEKATYRLSGIDPEVEQDWRGYAVGVILFSLVSILVVYVMQRIQPMLPLNPTGAGAVAPDLAFNTGVSFTTNTNWQNYSARRPWPTSPNRAGLTCKNFVSAAVGIVVAVALVRGLVRRSSATIGNFWADLVRLTLYVLLPIPRSYSPSCWCPRAPSRRSADRPR